MSLMRPRVLIKGAGEMASGVACRLHRAGLPVVLTERPEPLAVRRAVSFCEAVHLGSMTVEGSRADLVEDAAGVARAWQRGRLAVAVDPELSLLTAIRPEVLVEATLSKVNTGLSPEDAPLVIALGPGYEAGTDAHCVVETMRGHHMGRLVYRGRASADTGVPGLINGYGAERILRAPAAGHLESDLELGAVVARGQEVARVAGLPVTAGVAGVLRGLVRPGMSVWPGLKIGDVDPRAETSLVEVVSEKARAVGGAVLEAVMARFNRGPLWSGRSLSRPGRS